MRASQINRSWCHTNDKFRKPELTEWRVECLPSQDLIDAFASKTVIKARKTDSKVGLQAPSTARCSNAWANGTKQ